MIVSEKEALERLGSPLNLMNRLHTATASKRDAMGLFGMSSQKNNDNIKLNPSPPTFVNPFSKPQTALPAGQTNSPEFPSSENPDIDNLLDNADSRIKLTLAHDKALDTLVSAVDMVKNKLDDIKPEKLATVIAATSKVVDQIQRQRLESNKIKSGKEVHFHFYTPTQKKVDEYDVIDVG